MRTIGSKQARATPVVFLLVFTMFVIGKPINKHVLLAQPQAPSGSAPSGCEDNVSIEQALVNLPYTIPPFSGGLRYLLKAKAAPHIDTLVKALNEAPANEQCQWLEAAVEWF